MPNTSTPIFMIHNKSFDMEAMDYGISLNQENIPYLNLNE